MDRTPRRLGWFARLAAGLLLFWIAFRDLDPSSLGPVFARIDYVWLAAAVLSTLLTVAAAAARWRVLLDVRATAGQMRVLYGAIIVSQVANIVMPFKLGDAVRIGAVSRALALPPAVILASVAVERIFEMISVALAAMALAVAGELPSSARAGLWWMAGAIGAVLIAVLGIRQFHGRVSRAGGRALALLPRGLQAAVARHADRLIEGFRRTSRRETMVSALAFSGAVIAGSVLTAYLVMLATGLAVPAVAAAVVVVVLQIGNAVLPVPGAVGVAQVLTVQTLALWQVPEGPALAYALVLYLVARVPKVALMPAALSALRVRVAEPACP